MIRAKVKRLEAAHSLGRAAWEKMAAEGQREALEAVQSHGGDVGQREAVRRAFADFRQAYTPGADLRARNAAAGLALDTLREALPRAVYVEMLARLYAKAQGAA